MVTDLLAYRVVWVAVHQVVVPCWYLLQPFLLPHQLAQPLPWDYHQLGLCPPGQTAHLSPLHISNVTMIMQEADVNLATWNYFSIILIQHAI